MPAALPQGPGTRVFAGARSVFMFNGEVIGFASGCNGSEEIQYEPIDTLDHLEVREHVPVGYRVTFTASIFRTISRGAGTTSDNKEAPGSLKAMNMFPKFGNKGEAILKLDGVDAAIQDTVTGKTIFLLENVKTAAYNFSVTARGVVAQNVTFVATRAKDESEIEI
jgi:hypothetical protein